MSERKLQAYLRLSGLCAPCIDKCNLVAYTFPMLSEQLLEAHTLQATPNRVQILDILQHAKEPLDISTILEFLNNNKVSMNRVTVFRIMNLLTEKGVIQQYEFNEGKFRYEITDRAHHHHHIICKSCKKVECIKSCLIPPVEKTLEKEHNFKIESHKLEFFGLCEDCQ